MEKSVDTELDNCTAQVTNVTNLTVSEDLALGYGETTDTFHLGLPLIETDFVMALVYIAVVSVALIVGTFGNSFILIITWTAKTVNRTGRPFIFNLALADLCVAAVADPMCILGVLKGERWFDDKPLLCVVVASMCLTACICAFLSLSLLTFSRYIFVCHNRFYYKIFKTPVSILLCILCWIVAFFCEFPSFIGWGGHVFDRKNHQCIWDRTASLSYTLFVTVFLIATPLVLMAVGYILIFRKIWQKKFDVVFFGEDDPNRLRRVWQEALSTSKILATVFFAFLICWTPYALVTGLDVNNSYSVELHLFVTLLAHTHSSLNFVIYSIMNKKFRMALLGVCIPSNFRKFGSGTGTVRSKDTSIRSLSDTKGKMEKNVVQFTPVNDCNMTLASVTALPS